MPYICHRLLMCVATNKHGEKLKKSQYSSSSAACRETIQKLAEL